MTSSRRIPALRYPIEAVLTLPGSKSHANRALICACLAQGTTVIGSATPCDDVAVMVEHLGKLGFLVSYEDRSRGIVRVQGGLQTSKLKPQSPPSARSASGDSNLILDCHNAGTTLRFLVSIAALLPGEHIITGDRHMRKRPIEDLTEGLRRLGADVADTAGCPPITVRGGTLRGGTVTLDASVSSQYVSSLLLIAPLLPGGLKIELSGPPASPGYVQLTMAVMADFGVKVVPEGNGFRVPEGKYRPRPEGYDIEGDWSAAGAWLVFNELTGSRIECENLSLASGQSDRLLPRVIESLRKQGDAVIDVTEIPDQTMNLAVLAACRSGKTTINGARNLRRKECDRLAVTVQEFRKVGIDIQEHVDGLIIQGSLTPHTSHLTPPVVLDPHRDHRMAMCFAILGLLHGNCEIIDLDCVIKSYPSFWSDFDAVIGSSRPIVIVGMRGAGKSNIGRRLAAKLKLKCVDADHAFEKEHGPIREFVKAQGWEAFRTREEEIIGKYLQPGVILSCGGGAVESSRTRALLKEHAIGVWVQASKAELVKRLSNGKRPPLTNLPLPDEVEMYLQKRTPLYEEVSVIRLPSHVRFSMQVPYVITKLRALTLRFAPSH